MPFDNEEVAETLLGIDNKKLLLIDWNVYSKKHNNYVFQDFGEGFFNSLKGALPNFRKYKKLIFLYPCRSY